MTLMIQSWCKGDKCDPCARGGHAVVGPLAAGGGGNIIVDYGPWPEGTPLPPPENAPIVTAYPGFPVFDLHGTQLGLVTAEISVDAGTIRNGSFVNFYFVADIRYLEITYYVDWSGHVPAQTIPIPAGWWGWSTIDPFHQTSQYLFLVGHYQHWDQLRDAGASNPVFGISIWPGPTVGAADPGYWPIVKG